MECCGTDLDEVHVNDLIEGLILSGNFFSFLDLSLLQEVWQVRFLSVSDFEVVLNHGVSQSVQGFQLGGTQRGFLDTVSVKREPGPLEVLVEVVHPPGGGSCL